MENTIKRIEQKSNNKVIAGGGVYNCRIAYIEPKIELLSLLACSE